MPTYVWSLVGECAAKRSALELSAEQHRALRLAKPCGFSNILIQYAKCLRLLCYADPAAA